MIKLVNKNLASLKLYKLLKYMYTLVITQKRFSGMIAQSVVFLIHNKVDFGSILMVCTFLS